MDTLTHLQAIAAMEDLLTILTVDTLAAMDTLPTMATLAILDILVILDIPVILATLAILDILVILDILAMLPILVVLDTLHTPVDIILPTMDTMGDIHTMLEPNKLLAYRHLLVQVLLKRLLLRLLWLMMARHMMNI